MPRGRPTSTSARGEVLSFLQQKLVACSAGAGGLVIVEGGTASGKTHLLNDFLRFAADSGTLTLSATGAPDEQNYGTGIIEQLFINSSALPANVADQVAEILHEVGERVAGVADPEAALSPIVQEIRHILLGLARGRTMVIGVDDLQYADASSLQLLLQLQRRIRSVQILIVLTLDRGDSSRPEMTAHFDRLPHDRLHLRPLDDQAIAELTAPIAGPVTAEQATRLRTLSAGNPMLAAALAEDFAGDGEVVAGTAFGRAVVALLHRHEPALREIAGTLAMLGEYAGHGALARTAGVSSAVAEDALAVLTDIGLIENGQFRHPAAKVAAADALPPATRSRLHLQVAHAKYRQAAPAEEIAGHLVAAGQVAPDWSTGVLRRSAEIATVRDDLAFAGRCLELALTATTDRAERRMIRVALARVTFRVNPYVSASCLAALDEPEPGVPPERAESMARARLSLWNGDREGLADAVSGWHESGQKIDSRSRATLTLAAQWHFGPGHAGPVAPVESGAGDRDPWSQTTAGLAEVWRTPGSAASTASAERILHNCPLEDSTLEALATAVTALAYGGQGECAERWCAQLVDQAGRRGALTWQAFLGAVGAGLVLRRGAPTEAAAQARQALDRLPAESWGVSIAHPLATLVTAETVAGRHEAAARVLRHPVPPGAFKTIGGLLYLRARGRFQLATGRLLAAISDFMDCRRLLDALEVDLPALVPWRADLAEAYLRFGNGPVAQELARQQLARSPEADPRARALGLRVLGLAATPAEGAVLLRQAADTFQREGDLLEATGTRKLAGATAAGPRPPATRVWRETPPSPPPEPREDPAAQTDDPLESMVLSEAELRVAQLAALGQTNREIGGSLFITVSTVEQHLTRVYRKLGIRSRSELPMQLID